VVREWFRLLKPGGWLLFSTPNNESVRSLLALVCRGHYSAFGETSYPAHITALLRKDLERITREAGFEMIQFHFTDHGILPKAKRLTWQVLSAALLRGLRFSDNLLAVCRKPTEGDDQR
jgi:2-polyprenyl-3-methyl-5-hydroxy-6-metoxy-1,4-benzoquinol methylase